MKATPIQPINEEMEKRSPIHSVHFTTRFRVFCRYTGTKRRVHVMVPSRGDAYILHCRPRFRCKYWES